MPESITAFLESSSVEESIRLAVSLGGDSDTMACIAGAIAEPFFGGVPVDLWSTASECLDEHLRSTVQRFQDRYPVLPAR